MSVDQTDYVIRHNNPRAWLAADRQLVNESVTSHLADRAIDEDSFTDPDIARDMDALALNSGLLTSLGSTCKYFAAARNLGLSTVAPTQTPASWLDGLTWDDEQRDFLLHGRRHQWTFARLCEAGKKDKAEVSYFRNRVALMQAGAYLITQILRSADFEAISPLTKRRIVWFRNEQVRWVNSLVKTGAKRFALSFLYGYKVSNVVARLAGDTLTRLRENFYENSELTDGLSTHVTRGWRSLLANGAHIVRLYDMCLTAMSTALSLTIDRFADYLPSKYIEECGNAVKQAYTKYRKGYVDKASFAWWLNHNYPTYLEMANYTFKEEDR